MIVPRTSDRPQQPQGPQPSEEMMLMALAHMKDIGRIKIASTDPSAQLELEKGVPVSSPTTDKDTEDLEKANLDMGLRVRPDAAGEGGREYRRKNK